MRVTFLGAGAYGEALKTLVENNEHEVRFYDPFKFPEISLDEAVKEAEVLVYTAPSSAAGEILPKLPKDLPLICSSKGFLSLQPFEGFTNLSALGGAAFAEDIKAELPTFGDQISLTASAPLSEQLFTTDYVKVEHSPDTFGILLCGSLKNVYAIGAGLLEEGTNPEGYFRKAFHEMQDFLFENGCDPDTALLSCGLPDLILTASERSRNFRFGCEIYAHPNSKIEAAGTVEGVSVINSLKATPSFQIPSTCTTFLDIVEVVRNAL